MVKKDKELENIKAQEGVLSLVVDRYENSKKSRDTFEENWDRFYKLYRFKLNDNKNPYQSNLFIPYSFANVETVLPRMVANRPNIEFIARTPEDQPKSDVLRNLLDYQWDIMDMDVKMAEFAKQMLIYGTSVAKVYWKLYKNGKLYDNPEVDVIDIYDFFIDPEATSIEDAKYVIHRIVKPLKEIKDDPKYKNTDLIKGTSENPDEFREQRDAVIGKSSDVDAYKKSVELLEYWEDDRVITVANKSVVIRDEKNPFKHKKKPFVYAVDQAVTKEFYGIGEIEPLESLQNELNDLRNQRMDNVNLVLNRVWKARRDANIQWDTLVSKPGGVILTDQMDDVEALTTPDITASSYREEDSIKSDIQNTTGVTDYITGITGGAATATEIVKKTEESNYRFKQKIANLENMFIKKLGEMLVELNKQYMDREKTIRVVGEAVEYYNVYPEDLDGDFDIKVEAGSTMPTDRESRRAQALELYKIFKDNPLVNQVELAKTVIESYELKNIAKLFNQPETVEDRETPPGYHVMPDGQVMSNEEMQMFANSEAQSQAAAQGVMQNPGSASPVMMEQLMSEGGGPVMADDRQIPQAAQMRQSQYANSGMNRGV